MCSDTDVNPQSRTSTFAKEIPGIGRFSIHPLRIPEDIDLVHSWVSLDYARYWGMQGCSKTELLATYQTIILKAEVFIGYCDDRPCFLLEAYSPEHDPVGEHYDVQAGDKGMHILVAPAQQPVANFTWSVFTVVMDFLFSDASIQRVVVEPDVDNDKIHALNKRAGFDYQGVIQLADKSAYLAFCTRAQYTDALHKETPMENTHMNVNPGTLSPAQAVDHLRPEIWEQVNRLHIRKALSEFAHERLIQPVLTSTENGWDCYCLVADSPDIEYHFRARILSLDHWHIDPGSIEKFAGGHRAPLDSLSFIIEINERLGIGQAMLPTYLEEIASTLYGSAYKHAIASPSVDALIRADFQTVESAMMEGHPSFVANNGRIGFDANDYQAYAPEAGASVRLVWLAAHKRKTVFACSGDLSYQTLIEEELGGARLIEFSECLKGRALNPDDYVLMPVHPWQWFNKLASLFAQDIATGDLICLGYGDDGYQAQQSIRTFFNTSRPCQRYVKTALSILNMGFMRGLSPYYMSTTPAINDWINNLVTQDPFLSECGFGILREVAAVGYRNSQLEAASDKNSPYRKMLSALWRESPVSQLAQGQRLMTMASLLHIDAHGQALLPALIQSSGLDTDTWLRHYLTCYMSPLLHCFYAHDLVFMPHGENLILVFENNVPVRAIMKDIAEEVAILNTDVVLADEVQRLKVDVAEELKVLSIFTDVFDCIFRYLNHILVEHADYPQERFWGLVADTIKAYQRAHPELSDKFERYDLFAPEFRLSCLNRLQQGNNQQMVDLADPTKNLKFAGRLKNPIAAFKDNVAVDEASVADA